jgi:hypothetical protein
MSFFLNVCRISVILSHLFIKRKEKYKNFVLNSMKRINYCFVFCNGKIDLKLCTIISEKIRLEEIIHLIFILLFLPMFFR